MIDKKKLARLSRYFHQNNRVVLAFLFGSQVTGKHTETSDCDIALLLEESTSPFDVLGEKELIRSQIRRFLNLHQTKIDLVDLSTVGLSLASSISEEGIVLKGDGTLELSRFYLRTWALEEDFYWRLENENRAISG